MSEPLKCLLCKAVPDEHGACRCPGMRRQEAVAAPRTSLTPSKAFRDTRDMLERRATCPGHDLLRMSLANPFMGWRCANCSSPISNEAAELYRQGLQHGKQLPADCTCNPLEQTGGRHAADCPERKNEAPEPRE